jgi:uncharacterized protein (UPF0264 family)
MSTESVRNASGLLVSVRGPSEVEAALQGGADLIDVKEPARGALGRADADTIAGVAATVAGRRPVSATLGELLDWLRNADSPALDPNVQFVKIGLAGCASRPNWRDELSAFRQKLDAACSARLVVAAYADWRRAAAPQPADVMDAALHLHCGFLIDTFEKDGTSLLDWMNMAELIDCCLRFRSARLPIALAGALDHRQVHLLRPARPNWFAVRGSVCAGGRNGKVEAERVRRIKAELVDAEKPKT